MVTPSFSWDQFQKNPQQQTNQSDEYEAKPEASRKEYAWGDFKNTSTYQGKPDPTEDESTFGYLTRNIVSNAARIGEGFLGRYGDVKKTAQNVISEYPSSLGLVGRAIHDLVGDEMWKTMVNGIEGNPVKSFDLPTSSELREVTEGLTGDYTKPKNKTEKYLQNVSSDIGSAGRRLQGGIGRSLLNNLGIPAASNAAKEAVEGIGFGETAGAWTKGAAQLALSLLNVNAPAHAAELMNAGRNAFGNNVRANVPRYYRSLGATSREMLHGDPRSALAQQQLDGIRNDIQNGQTSMRDLMNRYDAINAAKRDRGLFQLGRPDRKVAIRNIDRVRDMVRREIEHIGRHDPMALNSWQNGVNAFAAIHRSQSFTNWVRNTIKDPFAKTVVAGLFGAGALKSPLIAGPLGAVAPALYKAGQVAYRVWRDPNLARYYWNAIRAATQEDVPVFLKMYNKLDEKYKEKYEKSVVAKPIKKSNKSKKNEAE